MGDLSDFNALDLTVKYAPRSPSTRSAPDVEERTASTSPPSLPSPLPPAASAIPVAPAQSYLVQSPVGVGGGQVSRGWYGYTRRLDVEPISPCSPPPPQQQQQQQKQQQQQQQNQSRNADDDRYFQFQPVLNHHLQQQQLYSGRGIRINGNVGGDHVMERKTLTGDHDWRPAPQQQQQPRTAETLRAQLMSSRPSTPEFRAERDDDGPILPPVKKQRRMYESAAAVDARPPCVLPVAQYSPLVASRRCSSVDEEPTIGSSPVRRHPVAAAVDASVVYRGAMPNSSPHAATSPRGGTVVGASPTCNGTTTEPAQQQPQRQQQKEDEEDIGNAATMTTTTATSGNAARKGASTPTTTARFNEYYLSTLLKVGRGSELSPSMFSYLRDLATIDTSASSAAAAAGAAKPAVGRSSIPTSVSSSPLSTTNDSEDREFGADDSMHHQSSVHYQTSINGGGLFHHGGSNHRQQFSPILGGSLPNGFSGASIFGQGSHHQQQLLQQRVHEMMSSTSPSSTSGLQSLMTSTRRPRQLTGTSGGMSSSAMDRDEAYRERRRKNNEAAKRSRDTRRQKEMQVAQHAALLEQENIQLKAELAVLRSHAACLQRMVLDRIGSNGYSGTANNNNNVGANGSSNGVINPGSNNKGITNGNHSSHVDNNNYYIADGDESSDAGQT